MDSIKHYRKVTLRHFAEISAAACLATVIVYAAVFASSPAAAPLLSLA